MVLKSKYTLCVPKDALTSLDRVNSAIAQAATLDGMLARVLDEMLEIFSCDRAWVLLPCDPDAAQLALRAERVRPGWPGAKDRGGTVPVDRYSREYLQMTLEATGPVRFDALSNPIDRGRSHAAQHYGTRSMMTMPLRPKNDSAWVLGIHHCAREMTYEAAAPLFDAIGKRLAEGLTTQNAIDEIRRSEERFRALVDRATEAIMIYNVDEGRFIEANPAAERLFGIPAERLFDAVGPQRLSPDRQPDGRRSDAAAAAYIREALNGGFPHFEWTHLDAAGNEVLCDVALVRFPDPDRNLVRAGLTDITGRKRAEQQRLALKAQLAQSQKLEAIGQMTGGVAHDFNNLLSIILGNLELLQDEISDIEQLGWIEAAIEATGRGADLTQKMLAFARRAHLKPAVLDLNTILREMDNWMSRTLPATIKVRTSLAAGLWPIAADRASTESALLNLIINARDAMPAGGCLSVETANAPGDSLSDDPGAGDLAPGDYVVLSVGDTGSGIERETAARVFEPFYTTKLPGQGSGLGLSMVHGFMKQTGGAAAIGSEPGRGTTVKLYFPARGGAADTAPATAEAAKAAKVAAVRILMAEDQPDVREVLVRILRTAGYDVTAVESGDAALERFRAGAPFDLLITDIVMPGRLQGPALARALRHDVPGLPVLFMSGYAGGAAMHGDGPEPADIRLMKPVSRARLLEAVRSALAG